MIAPRAVLHQHVVGDPDRDPRLGRRVGGEEAGEDAGLLLGRRALLDPLDHAFEAYSRSSAPLGERSTIWSTSGCSGASTKKVAPKTVSGRVVKTGTSMSSSSIRNSSSAPSERPIQLRWIVFVRSGQSISSWSSQQRVRVGGDAEEPLLHLPDLDLGAAAVAMAVHDLLVRQHGLVVGAPVDRRLLAVGQPLLQKAQEQPLRPAVVGRVVGGDHAVPVDRPAQPVHLAHDVGRCSAR